MHPRGFNLQQTFSGGAIGAAIGIAAFLLDASPWWWLAVPIGLWLGASLRFQVSVLWARK
jgi:phosphotransferase system  glucose/maltose/N-acetylglucosamine-specific IIC component